MPHIDSPLQEPHPRHASATIVTTEREYIPPKPPTRNILPRGSPHKRTPIGHHAGGSAVGVYMHCVIANIQLMYPVRIWGLYSTVYLSLL